MAAKILAKLQKNTFLDKFLKKTQESKVCPKKVGLFQFKVGWFKIKTRTNLGPQNYMYLSAPGILRETCSHLLKAAATIRRVQVKVGLALGLLKLSRQ